VGDDLSSMPADAGIINATALLLWPKPREKPLETRGFDPHLVRSEAVRIEVPGGAFFLAVSPLNGPEADGSKKFNGGVDTQNGFGLYTAH
jgi:hypothetical protein